MVASWRTGVREGGNPLVSIPFIAGQWSLRGVDPAPVRRMAVSIPFIAGQWSLRHARRVAGAAGSRFQSPSLRGSGRFTPFVAPRRRHGGAMSTFQSPSLRGSGRFVQHASARTLPSHVSIPFIAGQWSLHSKFPVAKIYYSRFNPLHCGAVVASRDAHLNVPEGSYRFNPLHCGAVVASRFLRNLPRLNLLVSIPFIAGQWSLRPRREDARAGRTSFNPLHCGAVVASPTRSAMAHESCSSFNPLHCGAVVASYS